MVVAIGFNTVASLTAIALWLAAPCRGGAMQCLPGESASAAASTVAPRPASRPSSASGPHRGTPFGAGPGTRATGDGEDEELAPEVNGSAPILRKAAAVSASVTTLAERLHLNPGVLAEQLGDARGELPKPSADRLERGFEAGGALARRLGLDDSQAQALVALVTYYVFSILREEKNVGPGSVDPARIKELGEAAINDIRASCGEQAAAEATRELPRL